MLHDCLAKTLSVASDITVYHITITYERKICHRTKKITLLQKHMSILS